MKGRLFATGVPMAATAALANNEFLYAGNLMAASILQGGAAPCIPKTWVYDYMFQGLSTELVLSVDDITTSEVKDFVKKVYMHLNTLFECYILYKSKEENSLTSSSIDF